MRILVLLLLASGSAYGYEVFLTGKSLVEYCDAPKNEYGNAAACSAYLSAVFDSVVHNKVVLPNATSPDYPEHSDLCPPETGLGTGQLTRIWKKWSHVHPQGLHLPATGLVLLAYADAWPCSPPTAPLAD